MQISISTNFPDIERMLSRMQEDVRAKALPSAINKTVEQGRTQMVREITSEYRVTSAYARERLSIKRARFKAGALMVEAELVGGSNRNRSANIIAFMERSVTLAQARKRGKDGTLNQLRFQVRRAGGKKIITGAFIGNKGRTVFIRTGKDRLPIKAVQTIDIASMFNQKQINRKVVGVLKDRFPTIFEREARFFTAKFNGG
ncbi:phage tail protein [Hydrogenophaga sp.]|uniref:phage tail protein n=1 Tax=Hydrogenophaga sp. TaxID=1904254 RepID=UPI002731EAE5|nr:phage tail protein [Hydrogenophaga sp.]MDP1686868.1 phage tail protein [Hydrogenophaga sp.]